ncbi:MFS transporter [Haloarchaeobius iranensis]|uniref:Predicted arabinose efflux permease, MFS family n=1 Tax=Haloarchaeobius iranensis TaxID=996166 RepID=A0A1G9ZAF2_9EURY|nr:MFS transporter [Haloarchaeobius iranensis]SDN18478.1 Predicted arabinose efflux permease, MFS family [Haloarchaeobius iranensis]
MNEEADDDPSEDGVPVPGMTRRRVVGTLFLVIFLDLLGFGILIPVIPLYAKFFGANEFVGSLLIATYSLFQFAGAPILGRLSDERGRRPVLLLSLTGSVLAWTLFGLAGELGSVIGAANGLVVLFFARALAGAMGGNIATANAYMADITSPEDRAKGLGILGAAFGLGFVFGPAIAGLVSSPAALSLFESVLPAAVPVSEFTMPSFTAAALTAGNLVLAFFVLPEPNRRERTTVGNESRLRQLYDAVRSPDIGSLVVAFFLASFAFSAFESQFIFLTSDRLGYGTAENAVLLTYIGVLIAIVQGGLIGPLTDRFGEYRLALVGAGIQVVTLALVPFSLSWSFVPALGPVESGAVALALVSTPLAFGNALTNVSLNALVSLNADADEQGGAFGLTQSASSLARTFGPAAAGLLYVAIAYWSPFVVAGLLFVPILVLLGLVARGSIESTADA